MAHPHPDHEWLLTDGRGGFAMGTTAGVPTRRYHGWLIGATQPPVGRVLALKGIADRFEPQLGAGDGAHGLDLTRFRFGPEQGRASDGSRDDQPSSFSHADAARWSFETAGTRVERSLALVHANDLPPAAVAAARVEYSIDGPTPAGRLVARPLVALRGFHDLEPHLPPDAVNCVRVPGGVRVDRGGWSLVLRAEGMVWHDEPAVWRSLRYAIDAERGQDSEDALASPGHFEWAVPETGGRATIDAVMYPAGSARTDVRLEPAQTITRRRKDRLQPMRTAALGGDHTDGDRAIDALVRAADDFVVQRPSRESPGSGRPVSDGPGVSVIAGYPWFADWGRDTMISLPGLLLATGRFDEADRVLRTFARHQRRGLIPNRFDDRTGDALYNTVDASLWFVHAWAAYTDATASPASPSETRDTVARACVDVLRAYRDGTDHGISIDPDDGLITHGDANTQLTWMDAQRDGVSFTPRFGKPVEINALWVHALRLVADRASHVTDDLDAAALADRAAASFRERFTRPNGALADRLEPTANGWRRVDEVRPNQLFAASLEHGPIDGETRRAVVAECRESLLTPEGMRTLAPGSIGYRPRFEGDMTSRDAAYHQGTVWPWLLGPMCEAHLRAEAFSEDSRADIRAWLAPSIGLITGGRAEPATAVGQLPEVYDADTDSARPRRAGGCPAQAWSVAEVLRVLVLTRDGAGAHHPGAAQAAR